MTTEKSRNIEDLLAFYIDLLNEGQRLDPDRILAENPEHGPEILENLESFVESAVEGYSGQTLGTLGDYTLRRQIGRGRMGVVYDAWENSMDRAVALKVLPAAVAADDKAVARFSREARLAGKLSHEHIVRVYSTGVREGIPWYAMEFVEGETLAQIIGRIKDADPEAETPFGSMDEVDYFAKLARAFAEVADGLQHAHSKGVIHRDIKPSNLILDQEGRLRILDFGLARLEGQESLTTSGDLVGTPLYMSPEQARQKKIQVDHRTDVYSLGATMYEMLTGQPPFRGENHADTLSQIIERDPAEPRKLSQRIPPDLETIVLKSLRKDPDDRYETAEAMAQDLRRCARGEPIEARPQTGWERLVRHAITNRRKLVGLAGGVLLLVSLGILGYMLYTEREESGRLRDSLERGVERSMGFISIGELTGHFGDVERIDVGINGNIGLQTTSADELALYFTRWEGSPRNNPDIYFITRGGRDQKFATPARALAGINSPYEEWLGAGSLSYDNREIYFVSTRPGGFEDSQDLWVAQFNVPGNPEAGFHSPKNLGTDVNTGEHEHSPSVSRDGLRLYYQSGRQLYMAQREKKGDAFGGPVILHSKVWFPAISADELTLFWTVKLPDTSPKGNIRMSIRKSVFDSLGHPVSFNTVIDPAPPILTGSDWAPSLTADWPRAGSGLYFGRGVTSMLRVTWHPDRSRN